MLEGSIDSGSTEFEMEMDIESPASSEDVLRLARLAEKGCFIDQTVRKTTPVRVAISHNGNALDSVE